MSIAMHQHLAPVAAPDHGSRPMLSIIIVSWNTRTLLLECLAALPAAAGDVSFDTWVVDNGSNDGSVAAVREQFPHVHLVTNRQNTGFAAANNQAMAASHGRYVLLLNSDTVASPGSLERLVQFAEKHPLAGVVGPMLVNPDGSFQGSFADAPSFLGEVLSATGLGERLVSPYFPNYGPRESQSPRRVGYIQGACMLVRREALAQVGMMDEQYFMYSEETDWCMRMQRVGWQIWYTPEARILHYGGQSTRQVRRAMLAALYRSKVRFFRKHYGFVPALALRSTFVVVLHCKWLVSVALAAIRPGGRVIPAIGWHEL